MCAFCPNHIPYKNNEWTFTGLQSYQGQFLKIDLIIRELRES